MPKTKFVEKDFYNLAERLTMKCYGIYRQRFISIAMSLEDVLQEIRIHIFQLLNSNKFTKVTLPLVKQATLWKIDRLLYESDKYFEVNESFDDSWDVEAEEILKGKRKKKKFYSKELIPLRTEFEDVTNRHVRLMFGAEKREKDIKPLCKCTGEELFRRGFRICDLKKFLEDEKYKILVFSFVYDLNNEEIAQILNRSSMYVQYKLIETLNEVKEHIA